MATTEKKAEEEEKEGSNLLGSPTFKELENGRFQCVETGHELVAKDKEVYSHSKRCRLGLIEYALSHKKAPLNMFKQDPLSRSKLVCKLTGDTINKSEEHIWKHVNGKRFLNRLEEKEEEKLKAKGVVAEVDDQNPEIVSDQEEDGDRKKKKKKNKKKDDGVDEIMSGKSKASDEEGDTEETDFWMPPVGERWDFDDGGDRWGSGSESEKKDGEDGEIDGAGISLVVNNKISDGAFEDGDEESEELSKRTKRMSIEIGPSSFASRKKKSKKSTT
ncbi:surfeit locus protein 2 isoform X1 [Pyrus x bretschneideri]|uniref:surfeit locus protein 2 isoform X1 n=1 Tax=Pyrus x bretschneideri TaxID=225117 RepID=UPI00087097E5|nr:surfeit locus protein 2 isoform X1 [Pyrus x bretschneideri]